MKVLQMSVHFFPNVGGVETHLTDLIYTLVKRDWKVDVLSYRPLTSKAKWKIYEKDNDNEIFRIPWVPNLFYQLVSFPVLEFIYLLPGLFLVCPFIIMSRKPDVIHAHGLIAGFVGVFWGKIFNKRVIISVHNIYHFPKKGFYKNFSKWILSSADKTLCLSTKAKEEINLLRIPKQKISRFTYWINLKLFKAIKNTKSFRSNRLTILFIGRLVKEKGVDILLRSSKNWDRRIKLIIIGNGPLERSARYVAEERSNLEVVGFVAQEDLPIYYNNADLTIMPSNSEEGFGRVIIESLACGTPVIGANRGGISEAMDESVGRLINVTPENIKNAVEYFLNHKDELKKLSLNCRKFAERRYTERNVKNIIEAYQK